MAKEEELKQAEIIGKVVAEVHTLNTLVKTLFEKFDTYVERNQPQTIGVGGYLAIGLSMLTILALLFGSVIYIINSANAPIIAQTAQLATIAQTQQASIQHNTSFIQLTNKEVAGIKNMAISNESTLEWIIFQENLPKQIAVLQGKVTALEEKIHLHPNMIEGK